MSEPREDLLEQAERLIAALESHADPVVREQVRALLARIDTIHRTALTRLVSAIHAMAGDAFLHRLAADPAVRLLLMSYDLLAVDRRLLAEEALDAVRGHLHPHGIDVELTDVVGGVVYARLHVKDGADVPMDALRRDVETALAAGLPGFQELVVGAREPAAGTPLLQIGVRARGAVYRSVCAASAVPPGTTTAVDVGGAPVLVANVAGEFHAVADRCGDTPLPLRFGTLTGAELRCSWHGCRYDVRSGARLDRPEVDALRVYPVRVDGGEVRIAVGTTAVASP